MEHNEEYLKNQIQSNRSFMKSAFAEDASISDQQRQVAQPPLTKPATDDRILPLTKDFAGAIKEADYFTILRERKSCRVYVGCETCAIAAFDQGKADHMLGLDGEDEYVIYAAPVGVV